MSNEKPHITIIGLGMIGSSIGLALQQADVASAVIGPLTSCIGTSSLPAINPISSFWPHR
jgi:predicted dinucleotide-binding enzyme